MHPQQFHVNEAWIAFQLNDEPMRTKHDGSFKCICLMDAASCFILGYELIPFDQAEPSLSEVLRLFEAGWERKKSYPKTLFVPIGYFPTTLPDEANHRGILLVPIPQSELVIFIGEARQGFKEYREGNIRDN